MYSNGINVEIQLIIFVFHTQNTQIVTCGGKMNRDMDHPVTLHLTHKGDKSLFFSCSDSRAH